MMPASSAFQKNGVRTKAEIERGRTSVKALRGDFEKIGHEKEELKRADKVLEAVLNGNEQ